MLIDTHFLYWWMTADRRLGVDAQRLIGSSEITVSVASLWEMALKESKGKLPLPAAPIAEAIEKEGFRILPVRPEHIDAVRGLPRGLDDPFDRLLLATAMFEGLSLLTRDRAILKFAMQLPATAVRNG